MDSLGLPLLPLLVSHYPSPTPLVIGMTKIIATIGVGVVVVAAVAVVVLLVVV
jgi:hypothetical protein